MKLEREMEYFSNNIGLDEREWKSGLTWTYDLGIQTINHENR